MTCCYLYPFKLHSILLNTLLLVVYFCLRLNDQDDCLHTYRLTSLFEYCKAVSSVYVASSHSKKSPCPKLVQCMLVYAARICCTKGIHLAQSVESENRDHFTQELNPQYIKCLKKVQYFISK